MPTAGDRRIGCLRAVVACEQGVEPAAIQPIIQTGDLGMADQQNVVIANSQPANRRAP
ncbi:hypothetical protein I545_3035 [Mycobacterium kansasii 662]|uniref:Uncharacterized protein n=1 Tax=Mycobacterium kansasii 662 TaxID=1299326 RepID=X7ZFW5_MYCKA|nr:hypothetical protein I545_3035 [Mycobacterium kansasii 662]